ncbi:MAG: DUF2889 domain-containing protein [Actinomycetia bacterium]|nr:DUF2889 domain-containing protein [Actinomycetes bacterium]
MNHAQPRPGLPRPAVDSPSIPEPELPLLHDRTYSVRSYRQSDTQLRIRGQVRDQKPPGVYVEGDPEPLTVHHMVVDIVVVFPTLEITAAEVVMETHPHSTCPTITDHYEKLVGLSIARGFTHRVRELFGGPRGCTHTTALLQAMAPVAVQSIWSMRASSGDEGTPVAPPLGADPTDEQIRERFAHNLNSCHVWAEEGDMIGSVKRGEEIEPPLWMADRVEKLGLDIDVWRERMGG